MHVNKYELKNKLEITFQKVLAGGWGKSVLCRGLSHLNRYLDISESQHLILF